MFWLCILSREVVKEPVHVLLAFQDQRLEHGNVLFFLVAAIRLLLSLLFPSGYVRGLATAVELIPHANLFRQRFCLSSFLGALLLPLQAGRLVFDALLPSGRRSQIAGFYKVGDQSDEAGLVLDGGMGYMAHDFV